MLVKTDEYSSIEEELMRVQNCEDCPYFYNGQCESGRDERGDIYCDRLRRRLEELVEESLEPLRQRIREISEAEGVEIEDRCYYYPWLCLRGYEEFKSYGIKSIRICKDEYNTIYACVTLNDGSTHTVYQNGLEVWVDGIQKHIT